MRRFALLAVLLVAQTASAQQPKQLIEFSMMNDVFMAGSPFPGSMKSAAHVIADGERVRMDVLMSPAMGRSSSTTMITNSVTNSMIVLDHASKTYMEMKRPHSALSDSIQKAIAAKSLAAGVPPMVRTGEHKSIKGFDAFRSVASMTVGKEFPLPKEMVSEGNVIVMILEQWSTDDPKLEAAQSVFQDVFSKQFNPMGAAMSETPATKGVALETTSMMVQVPEGTKIDQEALLKLGPKADGVIMMMIMKMEDIKVLPADPARFEIPASYSKRDTAPMPDPGN